MRRRKRRMWQLAIVSLCVIVLPPLLLLRRTTQHFTYTKISGFDERDFVARSSSWDSDPYSMHAFNVAASDQVPSARSVPDTRHPKCPTWDDASLALPPVSVVVSFHNEARSALLRTVVSVLRQTPLELLREIVLVDDASSDPAEDGHRLAALPNVRLLRNGQRQGLIRSRVLGADVATADFVVFLDSHCEVNVDWLQPLLHLVLVNPRTIACPAIDVIDIDTFQYRPSSSELKGGFDWSLHFRWIPLTDSERSGRRDATEPYTSPTVAGGMFLVSKRWFDVLGKYDTALDIWGGENFEISFKSWMCGGSVHVVPCSRVGHVFRSRHPYSFPDGNVNTYLRNSRRIAEVWLDEYKRFFYDARPAARTTDISSGGSIQEQKELRRKLNCKTFSWYLSNVFPELQLPNGDDVAFGQLKQGDMCLDAEGSTIKFVACSPSSKSTQEWTYGKGGKIRNGDGSCLAAAATTTLDRRRKIQVVVAYKCSDDTQEQQWRRRGRQLIHSATGRCLDTHSRLGLTLAECQHVNTYTQQWDFSVELQAFDASYLTMMTS